jgi:uncharacterized membrane protein
MAHHLHIPADRTKAVTRALLAASGICLLLLIVRTVLTRELIWTCFAWNLFLAWMPLVFARMLCGELDRPARRRWLLGGLFIAWMLFFPNSAYIVTDLVHLKMRPLVPRWFDYIFITAYAWTGLSLCYLSLRLLHARVQRWRGERLGWLFVTAMLALGSFGIYLGRFLRWNSWDVLRPWKPLRQLSLLAQPATLVEVTAFCATFFLLSIMVYVVLHALAHLHTPVAVEDERAAR